MSEISFISHNIEFTIPDQKSISDWLVAIARSEGCVISDLNIVVMSDDDLRTMNNEFLGHDYYTDIITFPNDGIDVSGELCLSLDRIKENASTLQINLLDELHRVIAHGLLHLIGYNDKTEKERHVMRSKEDFCLNLRPLNVSRGTK